MCCLRSSEVLLYLEFISTSRKSSQQSDDPYEQVLDDSGKRQKKQQQQQHPFTRNKFPGEPDTLLGYFDFDIKVTRIRTRLEISIRCTNGIVFKTTRRLVRELLHSQDFLFYFFKKT